MKNKTRGVEIMVIDKIKIEKVASYKNLVEFSPKKINFLFGSNGSGKTTISNLLGGYTHCEYSSFENNGDEILVYNKNFVDANFLSEVKGIFTLGEDSVEAKLKIEQLKRDLETKYEDLSKKDTTLEGFQEGIKESRETLKENCWKIQQRMGTEFPKALSGVRGNKEKFLTEVLTKNELLQSSEQINIEELKQKYSLAFNDETSEYDLFGSLDLNDIKENEFNELLAKKIMGSIDSPIGTFISFLNNSDWVSVGKGYMNLSGNKCPFCQQNMPDGFESELNKYFDTSFQRDISALKTFNMMYKQYFAGIIQSLQSYVETAVPFLDYSTLIENIEKLEMTVNANLQKLIQKIEKPSVPFILETVSNLCEDINSNIESLNKSITTNNEIFLNKTKAKNEVKQLVWINIINEAIPFLEIHKQTKLKNNKAIKGISYKKNQLREEIISLESEIRKLEENLTNVNPTIREINKILEKFGFKGFKLAENNNENGTYKIVREDGSDAKKTLSEGEYNFITFLYYYHLIYGSHTKTSDNKGKIVVVDDPISSLDSNVIFIVSTLMKKIIKDCREGKNNIKQVMILTHNMYFHKEVSFLGSRSKYKEDEVLFALIRKTDGITYIEEFESNPIQTTYEMLWQDIKDERCSNATSFNNMRRILEHYFQVLGGINYEECVDKFEGTDKIICQSLISVINDGSHFISDDYVIQFDSENIQKYKDVFEQIFIKLDQYGHYKMMMER
ncbi:AAA family ATPase [Enterococcus faecalis]|uniref:AAA family ATPase n=1 Tax=Enterococcus faecalis TaxID=1351 RepID=UPI00209030B7|nr:AAA family ATPase [Enterococcus faecalis]